MINFDNSPTVYWLLGYGLAGIVILSSYWKKTPESVFLALCVTLLVFMRLPVIVFNREINVDESQMLSHALTLFQDPVYWRSVDGTTIGPLDNYLLVIPRLLGFQINYTSGRAMGLMCAIGTLIFLFLTIKNWFGSSIAKRLILIPLLFLTFTQEPDFVHYSSEQLPVFLLSLSVWILSKLSIEKGNLFRNGYFLGLIAGMTPFAKLQAVPQAFVIAIMAFWICIRFYAQTRQIRLALTLIAGGLTFPVATFVWAIWHGVFSDLIDFYLLGNVIYAGGNEVSIPMQFLSIFNLSPDFKLFTYVLIAMAVAGIWQRLRQGKEMGRKGNLPVVTLTIVLLAVSGVYAVTKSGNTFIHYLNFCIVPWTLLAACMVAKSYKWIIIFPVLLLLSYFASDAMSYHKERNMNRYVSTGGITSLAESPVVAELKKYTVKDDYMVVWGWQCAYYVEAQLAQGTAENHSERSIFNHAMREKYRSRYLSDIQRTKPAVFLDAVGKNSLWVQDRESQGFETFPALADFVKANYRFAGDFDDTRLYIRNDRF